MRNIFTGCKSLVYINLISFIEKEHITSSNIFSEESNNLIYCIDENQSPTIIKSIKSISTNNDCNNICFTNSRKIIIEKKKCIDKCINDDTYIYESNDICYNSDPKKSDSFFDSSNYVTDYSDNIDETEIVINSQNTLNDENSQINEFIPYTENTEKPENTEISEEIIQTESVNTEIISEENIQTDNENNNNKEKEQNTDKNDYENNIQTELTEKNEETQILYITEKPESTENLEQFENLKFTEKTENNGINNNTEKIIYTEIKEENKYSENNQNFSSENFFKQPQKEINESRLEKDEIIKNI